MGRLLASILARILSSMCLVTLVFSQGNDNAFQKLNVFSNLQNMEDGQNTFLPPYPVGLKLELTCQTLGSKTYWYEAKTPPAKLDTDHAEPHGGVHTSVFTINALNTGDDGRQLKCMKDSSSSSEDVELNVVDRPEDIKVDMNEVSGTLTCVAYAMNPQLELCWFKDGQNQTCQVPESDGPSTHTVVNLDVNFGELEKQRKSSVFTCRPQLVQTDAIKSLLPAALMHYQTLFQSTQEELKMTVDRLENCDSEAHVEGTVKDESGCYKVTIGPTKANTTKAAPNTTETTPALTKVLSKIENPYVNLNTDSPSATVRLVHCSAGVVLLALAVAVM